MDWKALSELPFSAPVLFSLMLVGRGLFFTTLEVIRPARALSYRSVVRNDLIALLAYIHIVFPLAAYLNRIVHGHPGYSATVSELPLTARIVLYFVLADFGHYWIHRLTHTLGGWGWRSARSAPSRMIGCT